MAGLYDLFLQVIAYAIIIFGIVFLMNFLTKGFVLKYLKVKASRGTKQLIRLHRTTGIQYFVGKTEDGEVSFNTNRKTKKHYKVSKYNVHREMGVDVFEIDEEMSTVKTQNWRVSNGHNTDHFDGLLVRALEKPNLVDKTKEMILFIMNIAQCIMLAAALFLLYNISQQLSQAGGVV